MCKRSDAEQDPLLNTFLQRYQLNLLSVPRAGADVGELYVHDGKRVGSPGQLASFLAQPFVMPPIQRGEAMAALQGMASNGVSIDLGVGLLGSFLSGFGMAVPVGDIKAKWQAKGASQASFSIGAAVRDSVDPGRFGVALIGNTLRPDHPLVDPESRYYVVTAVARCKSLTIALADQRGQAVELGADLPWVGQANASVEVARGQAGEVTVAGDQLLAFGVELYELVARGDRIRMRLPEGALTVRSMRETAARPMPALIGGVDGEVFFDLTDKE